MDRDVQEPHPARKLRRLCMPAQVPVRRERALLELDRAVILALEVQGLAQAVEELGALAKLKRLLETRPRRRPIGRGKRLPASP
ncbi:MAG TPA: hypothetical protein VNW68_03970 [Candidatus Limnocylindria bacterium]|nr:hypothetical protein [Candidatus Limnocylindria bacterium]